MHDLAIHINMIFFMQFSNPIDFTKRITTLKKIIDNLLEHTEDKNDTTARDQISCDKHRFKPLILASKIQYG